MNVLQRTLLNDDLVQMQFHLCSLYNPLLHCVFRDETKHTHRLGLANTVSTILFGCEERGGVEWRGVEWSGEGRERKVCIERGKDRRDWSAYDNLWK